jgi:ribosome biogenesis GTPase A
MKQIQWYPGHMAKTRRQISEHVKVIDVVLELLDARIPYSSQNPALQSMIGNTPKIVLLNKADLADDAQLDRWIEYYKKNGIPALKINANSGKGIDKILPLSKTLLKDAIEKEQARGRKSRPIRAMILGIPNVGKSTLINRFAKKKKLDVQNRPGVTRQTQYIRVGTDFELLDTPGILWPKFEDENVAKRLALTGAIKDQILPKDDVVISGFKLLEEKYPGRIAKRYDIEVDIKDILGIYDGIGLRRGCLLPGKEIDYERVSDIFLQDFRSGRLGKITLDWIDEVVSV